MRIYLDSNIFRKARKSSGQYSETVYNLLEELNKSFIFLFSDAHLYDLSSTKDEHKCYIVEDLLQMERYVGSNYLCQDHIYKKFHYYLATPSEAYESIDFTALKGIFKNTYDFVDSIAEEEGIIGSMIRELFERQIFEPSQIDNLSELNKYGTVFGNLKNVRSINDALKRLKEIGNVVVSRKDYKKYKNFVSEFVNRDCYSFEKWSFDFDEKMKSTVYKKTFTEMIAFMDSFGGNNNYDRFIRIYTYLDYFGVTEERSGTKQTLKNNSFWDIHKDAMHAFFASHADYFVTNDFGLKQKAFITYKLLHIQTEVLSVDEFISKSNLLQRNEDDLQSFLDGLSFTISNGLVIRHLSIDDIQIIKPLYPIFNYFNRLQLDSTEKLKRIVLFKSYNIDYGFMYAEIDLLIKKCKRLFGEDVNYKQENGVKEFSEYEIGEPIRRWNLDKNSATLSIENDTLNQSIISLTIRFNHTCF